GRIRNPSGAILIWTTCLAYAVGAVSCHDCCVVHCRVLELDSFAEQPLERLLKTVSPRLFGNWYSRGREQFPHHVVVFEPGDVWLSNGRTVRSCPLRWCSWR